jgi:hypothetical protein
MQIVKTATIISSDTKQMIGYRPGWRGGRRDIGAPRWTGDLNPPDFPFDLAGLPPDDWLFFDMRSSSAVHQIAWEPDWHPAPAARPKRGESKSRGRLRCPRPVYRLSKRLPWRHTDSRHGHSHLPDANNRSQSTGHDHHVAQVDHRKCFPITTLERSPGDSNHTTPGIAVSTANSTTLG